ncbi:anti-CBASS protein Acb1 family protein [Erwinia phyllosphaerae]|uniref:anti-CBASS protein Acb1 family protein n=1 Tax=Erwinia phyllosphaerae TaxID=2853256 RepID=UPI001FED5C8D|nr:anti-CBASS Acb1 family protein [Erwinia phyllosphaerae]MBV4366279.1 DUF1073 domain-containing protein [Erwinia phyllosphaerae]
MKALSVAINSLAEGRARALYGQYIGKSGNTKRQRIYQEFGYPNNLTFDDFYNAYERNAIAGSAVKRMLDGCWEDFPEVFEGEKAKDAEAESAWDKTLKRLLKRCWKQIKDADRRNMVGRYSAILIQLGDSGKWSDPPNAAVIRRTGDRALVKLIPVWESQLDVSVWDTDPDSENFGQPKMYSFIELPVEGQQDGAPARQIPIHPDRLIILAEGADDGLLTSGVPMLRAGFNKLLDIEKVSGGSAEGFLKNASRQLNFAFSEKTDFRALAGALGVKDNELADALNEQVVRLNENTDAATFMQAGTAEVLSVAAADPEPTWRTALSEFCATIPIPVKVLVGQITGERASTEDMKDWARTRMSRRNGFLADVIETIVRRFWLIGLIAPAANDEVTVSWSDLLAPSQADKTDNMAKMAEVAQKTQQAFGRAAVKENEIRAAGELQTLPEYENEMPPDPNTKPTGKDPLTDDEDSDNPNRNADRTA